MTLSTLTLLTLVFCSVLSAECEHMYGNFFYGCMGAECIIYALTVWYGVKTIRLMTRKNNLLNRLS